MGFEVRSYGPGAGANPLEQGPRRATIRVGSIETHASSYLQPRAATRALESEQSSRGYGMWPAREKALGKLRSLQVTGSPLSPTLTAWGSPVPQFQLDHCQPRGAGRVGALRVAVGPIEGP